MARIDFRADAIVRTITAVMVFACATLGLSAVAPEAYADGHDSLVGKLLVATPDMGDPRFVGTVIYIVKHDESGAMGLVVNRLIGLAPLDGLLQEFGADGSDADYDIPVYYGGPVQMNFGFVLHSTDYIGDGTHKINDDVAMTANAEVLEAMSSGSGPTQSLFALGYAGWGPGQLEGELKVDAWYTVPADNALVFGDEVEHKWQRAIQKRGIEL